MSFLQGGYWAPGDMSRIGERRPTRRGYWRAAPAKRHDDRQPGDGGGWWCCGRRHRLYLAAVRCAAGRGLGVYEYTAEGRCTTSALHDLR